MEQARLAALERYCHLTEFAGDSEVEGLLEDLYGAALEYMDEAGVKLTEKNPRRFDLAVNALVLQWYDTMRRSPESGGETGEELGEPPGFRKLLNQLKMGSLSVS